MAGLEARCLVIDRFLGETEADSLLAQMIGAEGDYRPSLVRSGEGTSQIPEFRASLRLPGRVGVDLTVFTETIKQLFPELRAAVGIPDFAIWHIERSIVAHGDGDFYKTHIDTRTQSGSDAQHGLRMLSCVYYLCRTPKAFGGGELAIHKLGGAAGSAADPTIIEPVHNRLAVFPSFIPHEVLPVTCESNTFADRRFSINCWFHKQRA